MPVTNVRRSITNHRIEEWKSNHTSPFQRRFTPASRAIWAPSLTDCSWSEPRPSSAGTDLTLAARSTRLGQLRVRLFIGRGRRYAIPSRRGCAITGLRPCLRRFSPASGGLNIRCASHVVHQTPQKQPGRWNMNSICSVSPSKNAANSRRNCMVTWRWKRSCFTLAIWWAFSEGRVIEATFW